MKFRVLSLRECALLGAPLFLVVAVGVVLSKRENERLAEQHRIESGPLRLVVWNVRAMPPGTSPGSSSANSAVGVLSASSNAPLKKTYDFSLQIDARVEGVLPPQWMASSRSVWRLQPKSAHIYVGNVRQPGRVVGNFAVYNPTQTAGSSPQTEKREATYWLQCEAPSSNAVLKVQFEAVGCDAKTAKFVGPRVAAPSEVIELRPFDFNNDSANNWKN